ncbi:cytochrome c1 [Amantichitinum ursilacus]|uniref:Cytochrome c1 n=1 Tax=Amantichitinum ursilacus TaxID=857265 RepID=A0A0N1JT59_9NEIS|nr:cytochrome c1 [Amantichitinum ursilacus]KPC54056.1 Cytochrome c1 precursor [Amantichitinum ursilacus]
MKLNLRVWLAAAVLALPLASFSFAEEGGPELDKAPVNIQDAESLQRGAQTFVNYCLSCHGATMLRYNRLQDIGLTEDQIKNNLMFTTDKVGNIMKVAMTNADAKQWLGAAPPDLSLEARARGADWLYTYLRSFYRDDSRPTGWNNAVFDKVGMPHVLWELQGRQDPVYKTEKVNGKDVQTLVGVKLTQAGLLTHLDGEKADTTDYDKRVGDLVNFMVYMSEPAQIHREQIGYAVVLFLLFILLPLVYALKKDYWKDVEH